MMISASSPTRQAEVPPPPIVDEGAWMGALRTEISYGESLTCCCPTVRCKIEAREFVATKTTLMLLYTLEVPMPSVMRSGSPNDKLPITFTGTTIREHTVASTVLASHCRSFLPLMIFATRPKDPKSETFALFPKVS